jgi:hypothetical protein
VRAAFVAFASAVGEHVGVEAGAVVVDGHHESAAHDARTDAHDAALLTRGQAVTHGVFDERDQAQGRQTQLMRRGLDLELEAQPLAETHDFDF